MHTIDRQKKANKINFDSVQMNTIEGSKRASMVSKSTPSMVCKPTPMIERDEEEQRVVEALYQRWSQVYKFVGWAVKRKINRDALLHALRACLAKRIPPGDCWAYCAGTLKITNGNHNEKAHVEKVKEDNIFNHIAEDLKKLYAKPQETMSKEELNQDLPF
jgi:hypothetical protein